ncbi:MAG: hypothetical protein ACRDQU_12485 [Pseudonocardiaceae bacterium]
MMTPDFFGLAFMGLWIVSIVMLALAAVLPPVRDTDERPRPIRVDGDESLFRLVWLSLLPEKGTSDHADRRPTGPAAHSDGR